MKKLKSYSSVWNFERVLHTVENIKLPMPVTFSQIGWAVGTFLVNLFILSKLPPLCDCSNVIIKYFAFPVGVTWFMSKKTFDGKRPYSYLKSVLLYFMRPHLTYAGKQVKYGKETLCESITIVKSRKIGGMRGAHEECISDKIYRKQPCRES